MAVVSPDSYPLESALGKDIGHMYREVHEEHGVEFRLGREINRFEGGGEVDTVVLDDGSSLETDLVIIAIGVSPNTGYIREVDLNEDGSISVDRHMRVCEDVYAAGDIARFLDWRTGSGIRIELWRLALQLGRLAARNMAGNNREYADVPFFWTMQYDVNTKYVGFCRKWDDIIYDGDPIKGTFLLYTQRTAGWKRLPVAQEP